MEYVIGILLIIAGLFLVVAVLMQGSKENKLSSSIAGGAAETFFGKNKAKTVDKKLNTLTVIVVICFLILVVVAYVLQSGRAKADYEAGDLDYSSEEITTTAETTAPVTTVGGTTTAPDTGAEGGTTAPTT
jgi:preprotein translocase subunit SecG